MASCLCYRKGEWVGKQLFKTFHCVMDKIAASSFRLPAPSSKFKAPLQNSLAPSFSTEPCQPYASSQKEILAVSQLPTLPHPCIHCRHYHLPSDQTAPFSSTLLQIFYCSSFFLRQSPCVTQAGLKLRRPAS